jgi:phosphoglucosamine mutase
VSRIFGTDGVRGLANRDVTADLALDLAVAAAQVLAREHGSRRPRAVVGRDPRASSEFLAAATVAGLSSAGIDVDEVGVLPTPAVALLTARRGADIGVMISASHNAMPDNGIKFFTVGGHKLDDAVEDEIEARLGQPWDRPIGADVGRISRNRSGIEEYVAAVAGTAPHRLDGMRIVVDCANGAASESTPLTLRMLGAEVNAIFAEPDGLNINADCGSTHPQQLQQAVVEMGADAGIAHDGDADRCLAVDAAGMLVDGDQILAALAVAQLRSGHLPHHTVVSTVMANEGFRKAMRAHGITYVDTDVGDRYVLEEMRRGGYSLGGEQSGHIVMLDHATTGDGLLTAVHLLAEVARTDSTLAELAGVVTPLPQQLVNVAGVDKTRVDDAEVAAAVAAATERLGENGRVLLRASGTEPVIRVMVEAATSEEADEIAEGLAAVVRERLALR